MRVYHSDCGEAFFEHIEALEQRLQLDPLDRVLLVIDRGAFIQSGAFERLQPSLLKWNVTFFDDFAPYFGIKKVSEGVRCFQEANTTVIVAIGGGTAIDMAKLIKYFSASDKSAITFSNKEITPAPVQIVAIPTTAGSGSEATHFAVLYSDGEKYSIAHPDLLPAVSIIDSSLLHSLPRAQRVATGLDALAQGIESYWSVGATLESQAFAKEAIHICWNHFEGFVTDPSSAHDAMMSRASHFAGKAINLSKTTACHAISYAVSLQHNVPHGIAVALTLGPMMRFIAAVVETDVVDPRGVDYVRNTLSEIAGLLDCKTAAAAATAIEMLFFQVTGVSSPADLGIITDNHRQHIAAHVNLERLGNNPRMISRQSILKMLSGKGSYEKGE